MSYSYSLHESIEEIAADDWDVLCRGDSDPLMDRRFILAVQNSMSVGTRFWHVLFRDAEQRPVASASLCSYPVDGTLLLEGWVKKAATVVSRFVPALVTFKMLFCGLPVSAGQSNLRFAPDVDCSAILKMLDELLRKLAKQEHVHCIILKEFDTKECVPLKVLEEYGYRRADSLPMNHANPNFDDFEDYVTRLPSRKRYPIRRSQKKFAQSGLRVVQLKGGEGVEQIYTDEVHRLYENVLDKATVKLEKLPPAFFREMARQMPDASAFTFVYQEDQVVAFAASAFTKSIYHQMFVGVDHNLNPECDLYFNLFFNAIDFGLKLHVSEMPVGQTADAFKEQKLGCEHRPLYFYIKGAYWLATLVLWGGFNVLFPPRYKLPAPASPSPEPSGNGSNPQLEPTPA